MKKTLFLLTVICWFHFCAYSQKYELGNVTKEELAQKSHPTDTSAVAAILFKKARTVFKYTSEDGFVSNTEFSIKIKVYKKEGTGWANFEIPYYTGYDRLNDDILAVSQAYTYNLVNGKIDKAKLSSESKYVEKFNDSWKARLLMFPNVKEGSIIELEYTLTSQNLSVLPDFQYQYKIPVSYVEYRTEIPEYFIYKGIKNGFVPIDMKEKIGTGFDSYDVRSTISYKQLETIYTADTIPALVEEGYVDNIANYYAKLEHELQIVRYPDQQPKQISTTWEHVAKSIYEDKDFGTELEKNSYFIDDLKKVTVDETTDSQKAVKIFDYVKKRMKWNGKYGYYVKNKLEKAYQEMSGNVAEINLMLTAMLRIAGLNANPVLVSTRDNGIALFPNRTKFNYVIVAVEIDNQTFLMDATGKNSLPDILPIRDLNWEGRMIKKDGNSTAIDLMPKMVSKDVVTISAAIDNAGVVTGKIKEQYFDYNAYAFRERYAHMNSEAQVERLEKKYIGIEMEDYSITNKSEELEKPVIENYSFKSGNEVEIIGDKMYLSPLLFCTIRENWFKQEKRQYPINFTFPNQGKYMVSITIPENYEVLSLPTSQTIKMGEDLGALKYFIANNGKIIQVNVTLDINAAIISAAYYEELKGFFTEVIKKETEKIVLKKV